jgi:hypothetical protein
MLLSDMLTCAAFSRHATHPLTSHPLKGTPRNIPLH